MQKSLSGLKNNLSNKTDLLFIIGENSENDEGLLNYLEKGISINSNYVIRHRKKIIIHTIKILILYIFMILKLKMRLKTQRLKLLMKKIDSLKI